MRCVSYTRAVPWSTHAEKWDIQVQNEMISEYIKRNPGWKLEKKYSDRKNDTLADAGFDKMVEDGMARRYDCIVLPSLYHCGTGFPVVRQLIFDTLYPAGIHFAVVAEDFTSAEKTEEEVAAYIEEKRRQTHSDYVFEWRAKQSASYVHPAAIPYGYVRSGEDGGIVKDGNVSAYVEGIFSRLKEGQPVKEIAGWLNSLGAVTPGVYKKKQHGKTEDSRNHKWTAEMVRQISQKKIYTGATFNKEGDVLAEDAHDAYISMEEWLALSEKEELENQDRRHMGKYYRITNPLSYRIFCKDCGATLQKRTDQKGEISFRCCHGCRPGKNGWMRRLPYDLVMQEVIRQLNAEHGLAGRVEELLRTRNYDRERERQREKLTDQMKGILAETEMEQLKRISLYERFCAGEISEEEYNKKLESRMAFYQEMDDRLSVIAKEAGKINLAFTTQNPWLVRYAGADIPAELEKSDAKRLIARVDVRLPQREGDSYSIEVLFLDCEWKQYLEDVLKEAEAEWQGKAENRRP